jgi:DNA polymerase (family 10)
MREDTGEIEAAQSSSLPRLIEPADLRGALHNHTVASDGVNTLEEMAQAAIDLGWQYLGIADHSEILNIGGRQIGVSADGIPAQAEMIRALNEGWADNNQDFRIFHGSECDILVDGALDYPDETRQSLSHIVGSVHALGSWRNRDEIANTEALIKAVENPTFTILGHPTGRILQGREGFPVDMHAVLRRMGELNAEGELKAVEINASPYRLDLDWRLCRYAKQQGVPVCINPDAHGTEGLADVWYGVQIARKGWLEAGDVLNTQSGAQMEEILGL